MEETKAKEKILYSRNEKIVRIITILGIVLSIVVGILLFPLGKASGGIIILCACAVSIFLITGFCTRRVKKLFATHKYKKVIYAGFYAVIIVIAMLTAALVSIFTTYSFEDLSVDAITYARENISDKSGIIENVESIVFDYFEYGNGYYFAIETDYNLVSSNGSKTEKSQNTYIKINMYTGEISSIESIEYEIQKAQR